MIKLIIKSLTFFVFTLLIFEIYIRIFHLYDDIPKFQLSENNLLFYRPDQMGLYNFGNRKEIESKYSINNVGFNSSIDYKFNNSVNKIALIGDSYIEGFHQDVVNSIGRKIEKYIPKLCYEYGVSDWNYNDYSNLIGSNIDDFNQFEYIFININPSDLQYTLKNYLNNYKSKLRVDNQNTILYKYIYKNIKLISSINQMGLLDKIKIKTTLFSRNILMEPNNINLQLKNFQNINKYFIPSFLKKKIVFIINSNLNYQESFISYLKLNNQTIDLKNSFNSSIESPYYVFDQHWNNMGRDLVSTEIIDYIINESLK
jgi:hypothetical protein